MTVSRPRRLSLLTIGVSLFFAILSAAASAQIMTIQGTVRYTADGGKTSVPVEGATVDIYRRIDGKALFMVKTNAEGKYNATLPLVGKYVIVVSAPRMWYNYRWADNIAQQDTYDFVLVEGDGRRPSSLAEAIEIPGLLLGDDESPTSDKQDSSVRPAGNYSTVRDILDGLKGTRAPAVTRDAKVDTTYPVAPPSFAVGRFHALVIGNNAYDESKGLRPLTTAVNDAVEVASVLEKIYGFEKPRVLPNATREQIMDALFDLRRPGALGPQDSLLIYYAGHGLYDAGAGYWLPVNASRTSNTNWVSADDITRAVRSMKARHVLVVSDSCYSATIADRDGGFRGPESAVREVRLQKALAGTSRTLMASGGKEPVADGGGGKHSVFANAFLRGLKEIDENVFLAADLFNQFVYRPVVGNADQTPHYISIPKSGDDGGDFVFVRRRR